MTINYGWRLIAFMLAAGLLLTTGCQTETPEVTPDEKATETPIPAIEEVEPTETATATATATPVPVLDSPPTPTPTVSRCAQFSGSIEVQVLVGPAEVVGLEPVAVGEIPIRVVSETPPYIVAGGGALTYEDVLEKEWGTYAVTLDMQNDVSGECTGAEGEEQLQLTLHTYGEQYVVVDAGDFYGEYPWADEINFDLTIPLQEGATVEGEGWSFVLHLSDS